MRSLQFLALTILLPLTAAFAADAATTFKPTPFRQTFYRHVCSFTSAGGVNCKLETDFLKIEDQKDLGLLNQVVQLAQQFANEMKGKIKLEAIRLFIETRFYPSGNDGWRDIGKSRDDFLLDRWVLEFGVAPDGHVSSCKVIEPGVQPGAVDRLCSDAKGVRFEPGPEGQVRTGRQVYAAYFRPLSDDDEGDQPVS